jgi:hypothetical protein
MPTWQERKASFSPRVRLLSTLLMGWLIIGWSILRLNLPSPFRGAKALFLFAGAALFALGAYFNTVDRRKERRQ